VSATQLESGEYQQPQAARPSADALRPAALSPREGYRRWAPHYEAETAISAIEDVLVRELTPDLANARLLDAGCGTARRLRASGAAQAIGIDLSPEMIAQGVSDDDAAPSLMVGDLRALPLGDASVDVSWCRLVLGHLPAIDLAYRELARVMVPGGAVIVSDFHQTAWAAGHRRTFRDADGVHEVVHFVHDAQAHQDAARSAGLSLSAQREGVIGPEVLEYYQQAGRAALYHEHVGLPVVLALAFRKVG
jgi:malonyl-CoA O-methyltransferase